jgi:N-acetylmuramoyl-L-alanine amidase
MKIQNHKLVAASGDKAIKHLDTPNKSQGTISPKYLIIHYTAGNSFDSSVNWLMNAQAKASAHLVIGRDGKIAQLGAFNKALWHAGVSRWANIVGLNSHSIGIELDNSGRLRKSGNNYVNVSGRVIPESEIVIATHKHESKEEAWQNYTQAQLDALNEVSLLIVRHYDLVEILGHEDVSPGRKSDPGPAFPMESFSAHVFGRGDDTDNMFKVTVDGVNFRSSPEIKSDNIIGKLKKDAKVEYIGTNNGWFNVFVVNAPATLKERVGWVHSSLLKAI